MSDAAPIGIALVGSGASARVFHEPVIDAVDGLEIVARVAHRTDDADAAFARPDVGIVVVTTSNDAHASLAERALVAGKHVVVEKPFTTRSEDADRLVAIARERGLVLTSFHNRRWDGDFRTVRRIVDGGLLGRVVAFESHFDRYRPDPKPGSWREAPVDGSGLLFDIGPHLVDQAIELFGVPDAIDADVRRERGFSVVDDAFTITLRYEGRLRATLGAGMLAREPKPRFVVRGTDGRYEKLGLDPQEDALRDGRSPRETGWGSEPPERWGSIDAHVGGVRVRGAIETLPGVYTAFYENVRDAILGRAELAVAAEDAARVIRILELARKSSDEGRPIDIEPDHG